MNGAAILYRNLRKEFCILKIDEEKIPGSRLKHFRSTFMYLFLIILHINDGEVSTIGNEQIAEANIRVRPMEPEDISATLAIDRKITGVRRAITYTDLITGDLGGVLGLSFVAEVRGEVVGFVVARHSYVGAIGEAGLIHVLGVDPDYWQQSIATKLVHALLERCKSTIPERTTMASTFSGAVCFSKGSSRGRRSRSAMGAIEKTYSPARAM